MKCMFCENVDLFPIKDCELNYDHHEGLYCPRCAEKYILNKNTGLLMRVDEVEIDEYENEYYDSGNPKAYVDKFIEECIIKNIKEREESFGVETPSYDEILEYVKDTIDENDLIKDELESISGTVVQLIEEYEELQEDKKPHYVTVGNMLDMLSGYDRDLPFIIQKDSEGNNFSPLSYIDSQSVYVPVNTWYGEKYLGSLSDDLIVDGYGEDDLAPDPDKAIKALFLVPIN